MQRQNYIQPLSEFVFGLEEQRRTLNSIELFQWSVAQLTKTVGVDSSWAGWLDLTGDVAHCCYGITSSLPPSYEQFWWTMRDEDVVAQELLKGRLAVTFDRQGDNKNTDGMVALCDGFSISKMVSVVSRSRNGPISMFMSAYRSGQHTPQLEPEAIEFLRCALDHLHASISRCGPISEHDGALIANSEGRILTASSTAADLLDRYWPGWRRGYLPEELQKPLSSARKLQLAKRGVVIGCRQITNVFEQPLRSVHLRPAGLCDQLTEREQQIAQEIAAGRTHKEIAARLSLSPATVRNRTQDILTKMGIHSKAALSHLLGSRGSA